MSLRSVHTNYILYTKTWHGKDGTDQLLTCHNTTPDVLLEIHAEDAAGGEDLFADKAKYGECKVMKSCGYQWQ